MVYIVVGNITEDKGAQNHKPLYNKAYLKGQNYRFIYYGTFCSPVFPDCFFYAEMEE